MGRARWRVSALWRVNGRPEKVRGWIVWEVIVRGSIVWEVIVREVDVITVRWLDAAWRRS